MLAWLVPNHYQPWSSFYNEAVMGVGLLLLALWLMLAAAPGGWRHPPAAAWALVGLAGVPWLQWAGGLLHFSGDAWVSSLYLLGMATAVCVGHARARLTARDFSAWLAATTLAGAVVCSGMALMQCLRVGDAGIWLFEIAPGARAVANLAQPNNLATLLAFGAASAWLLYEQRRIGALATAAAVALLLVGVTLSGSRTALLFVPAVLVVRWLAARHGVVWRARLPAFLFVFAAQCVLAFLWPVLADALMLSGNESLAARGVSSPRLKVWPALIDGAWMSPWVGYGWLQTGAAQLASAERHPGMGELWLHGHNLIVELFVWCGLPLGLLLAGLLLTWFASRVRRAATPEAAIGMAIVTVLGVHAMLELPHHYAFFLIPVGLWVGVVESERGARAFGPARSGAAIALVSLGMALALAWDYGKVEADFWLMRFETRGIGQVRVAPPTPEAPFLNGLTAFLRSTRTPASGIRGAAELETLRIIATRYPYSPTLLQYAEALALSGQPDDALHVMRKLRSIHGERRYRELRELLHQKVVEGQAGLAELDARLPD